MEQRQEEETQLGRELRMSQITQKVYFVLSEKALWMVHPLSGTHQFQRHYRPDKVLAFLAVLR